MMEDVSYVVGWVLKIGGAVIIALGMFFFRLVDVRQQAKLMSHDFQLQTLWDSKMRESLVAAFRGVVEMNSPMVIQENARSKFDRIAPALLQWYSTKGHLLDKKPDSTRMEDSRELYQNVEHEFGDQLLMEVRIPSKMDPGVDIWGAIALMREGWRKRNADVDSDKGNETDHDIEPGGGI